MSNLALALTATAQRHPDSVALRLDEQVLDYRGLDAAAAHLAGVLREQGVGAGDRVAVSLPNVIPFAVCYYGVLRLGAVVVPMNPLLKAREIAYHLSDSGAKVLLAWTDFADAAWAGAEQEGVQVVIVGPGDDLAQVGGAADPVAEVATREDSDAAIILYTSGTTGKPKGAELTHANLGSNAEVAATAILGLGPRTSSSGRCRCSTPSGRRAR